MKPGFLDFVPMDEKQLRRWESRRRVGPFFYAVIWGICVNGLIGFCVVMAFLCLVGQMKLNSAALYTWGFAAFISGLTTRWYEWHSQENRFRITSMMNQSKTASPEPHGVAL